jgi:uncharacterized protein YndB with AHSA1/START domain
MSALMPILHESVEASAPSCPLSTENVFASVKLEAEIRRVLLALVMPEYMETWMELPCADRIECYPDQRSFDRFRIDMFCAGCGIGSIHGSCLLSKPNKITYLWQREDSDEAAQSLVEMRLYGERDGCTLKLKHSGLWTTTEHEQYSRMWRRSLNKLVGLMKGTPLIAG